MTNMILIWQCLILFYLKVENQQFQWTMFLDFDFQGMDILNITHDDIMMTPNTLLFPGCIWLGRKDEYLQPMGRFLQHPPVPHAPHLQLYDCTHRTTTVKTCLTLFNLVLPDASVLPSWKQIGQRLSHMWRCAKPFAKGKNIWQKMMMWSPLGSYLQFEFVSRFHLQTIP